MNDREILLSISILVSGQPDNVRRCLESLRELREKVPCELLITDTGCPRETREMIEQYADEIIFFEWCKDFSKARNVGLQHAKGKWFMFLDDDEWFEDTGEIAEFFSSGEYQKYHYAYYYQRNYSNFQGTKYSDAPVLRMMEKTQETKFVYSIHECLYPLQGTGKNFNCYVHHYGYVYENWEQKLAKARRNIQLLQIEHENNPLDLHHTLQLAQEYGAIEEYEESLRISEEAIEIWEKYHKKSGVMWLYVNSLYANVLQCLLLRKEYEVLLERGRCYIAGGSTDPLATALLQGRMAVAAYELEQFAQCLEYVEQYFEAYKLLVQQPECYKSYETSLTRPCFERNLLQVVLQCGIRAALKGQDYQKAREFAEAVDWQEGIAYINQPLIKDLMKLMNEVEEVHVATLAVISNKLMERKVLEPYFADSILEQENPRWTRYALLKGEQEVFAYAGRRAENTIVGREAEQQLLLLRVNNLQKQLEQCIGDAQSMKDLITSYVQLGSRLQPRLQLAVLLGEAEGAVQCGDWKEAVRIWKEINVQNPTMGKLVKLMLEEIGNMAQEEQNRKQEFAALAVAVKKQAQMLLLSGQAEQAKAVLIQLQQMLPEDKEVLELLEQCN